MNLSSDRDGLQIFFWEPSFDLLIVRVDVLTRFLDFAKLLTAYKQRFADWIIPFSFSVSSLSAVIYCSSKAFKTLYLFKIQSADCQVLPYSVSSSRSTHTHVFGFLLVDSSSHFSSRFFDLVENTFTYTMRSMSSAYASSKLGPLVVNSVVFISTALTAFSKTRLKCGSLDIHSPNKLWDIVLRILTTHSILGFFLCYQYISRKSMKRLCYIPILFRSCLSVKNWSIVDLFCRESDLVFPQHIWIFDKALYVYVWLFISDIHLYLKYFYWSSLLWMSTMTLFRHLAGIFLFAKWKLLIDKFVDGSASRHILENRPVSRCLAVV